MPRVPGPKERGHNPDHPLYRKDTYNPKNPDEQVREAIRVAKLKAHNRYMDRLWGKGWADVQVDGGTKQ